MNAVPIPLLDFVPALSPRLKSPQHLGELAGCFEHALEAPLLVFATAPPRHGKTELLKHGIVHRLLARPTSRVAWVSYNSRYAWKRSREIRSLYLRAGGTLDRGARGVADWRTGHEDGGLWAAGVDGGWTGEGFDLIVVDDPVKGRAQAESAVERETLWEVFRDDIETRLEPGGSIIVLHTRWTTDDLGGRLLARGDYGHVHLPAIDAHGRPLWPERWSLEALRRIEARIGPYAWASLYMGRPFNRGGRVFGDVQFFDLRPAKLRIAVGLDFSYSAKTSSDWSVIVILGVDDTQDPPRFYVLEVIRKQEKAPLFASRVREVLERYPTAEARWYYAGAELGIADFLASLEVDINAVPAATDKFIRAQPVAAAWNGLPEKNEPGRIFIPRGAPWADDFVGELSAFTGRGDLHDDQVDAFAGAFDAAETPDWVSAMDKWRRQGGQI